jgi:hypothetical protein
MSLNLKDLTPV